MTHYEVLGVASTAPPSVIRQAYLTRARQHHPDFYASGDPSTRTRNEREMQRVNEAWQVLSDPDRRRAYDLGLRNGAHPPRSTGTTSPGWRPLHEDDTDDAAWLDDGAWLDEAPGRGGHIPRGVQLLPVALLGVAVLAISVGLVTSLALFFALGLLSLVLSAVTFLAVPAYVVLRAHQADRE